MAALETIEKEIMQLSEKELSEFRRWFAEFDADLWDAQIESDAAAGRLDKLAEEALDEYYAGKARKI
jgi:succinate dehydrogenase flavin-adding protein (antitoxin of CptAB toxin-antitoxin module)